jgi:nitroimidazol reductase NimA-like FMN-containing flavoprotein (pyridoxamine 5'-phosphate oxidase superfamily)
MQLTSRFKIKETKNIVKFFEDNSVGRVCTIDKDGFPQVIPMNFVFTDDFANNGDKILDPQKVKNKKYVEKGISAANNGNHHAIYMHSHHRGEKIENLKRNPKVGFEVDKEVCFLPSYYFHPSDASFADTLYISVVVKGTASILTDNSEKAFAMNSMMKKYQREGKYTPLTKDMKSIQHLTVLKINPEKITGKYKIGQQWSTNYRVGIAKKIIEREGTTRAKEILEYMKIRIMANGEIEATATDSSTM